MSASSAAAAVLPHPNNYNYQFDPHHNDQLPHSHIHPPATRQTRAHYAANGANGYSASATDVARTAATSRLPTHLNAPATTSTDLDTRTSSTSDMSRRRPVDWNQFYKNGVPTEVIVIADTPPREQAPSNTMTRHTDKKRRTNGQTFDPVYQQTYSTTQTPAYYGTSSSNNTASTDRTTAAYNTSAATSLASQAGNVRPLDTTAVGQKRKRTRAAVAAEETEAAKGRGELSPFSSYVPPPRPPIKARDVHVDIVPDRSSRKDQKVDDDDGHYNVQPNTDLTERYKITRLLGQGTFGKVVEAYDRVNRTNCAIKIIRSVQKYRDASRIELRVLATLAENDRENVNRCIHLRECFDFRNHICIVTDLYGQSVFDFLKGNQFTPFPNSHIQLFARQLLTSVAFLHDLNLIHTDLKPENILLVDNSYQTFTYGRTIPSSSTATSRTSRHRKVLLKPEIRLIDFGSATFNDEYHSSVVSTRHYRAPEIILNLGWSFPCDIWSIGCILVEFFTGDALFQTHDNLEHLAMMEAVCESKLDRDLVTTVLSRERGSSSKNPAAQYFKFREKKLDYPNTDTTKASRKYVRAMKKLTETIPPTNEFNRQFLDLLRKIFVYNPDKRITAKEALKHRWFKEATQDDGTEAARIRVEKMRAQALAEQQKLTPHTVGRHNHRLVYP